MDKVLLIENSGLTFRCDSVPSAIRESTDKTGMMILKGVPATILDKEPQLWIRGEGIPKRCRD
jgi:hypothetical protein